MNRIGITVRCPATGPGTCSGNPVGATRTGPGERTATVRAHYVNGRLCPGAGKVVTTTRGLTPPRRRSRVAAATIHASPGGDASEE